MAGGAEADPTAEDRIERERDRALARYKRTRDPLELEATMRRLDAEEQAARHAVARAPLSAAEVVAYLRDLPRLWADGQPEQRRALAEALFARVRALGIAHIEITPTGAAAARGLAEAFGADEMVMVGARRLEAPPNLPHAQCTGYEGHDLVAGRVAGSCPERARRE